jgi:hypothetical protein
MKRRVLTILLFLLLGAMVNVAIAWALAVSVDLESAPTWWEVKAEWPEAVPDSWPGPPVAVWREGFGWCACTYWASAKGEEGFIIANHYLESAEVGWPCSSLCWRVRHIVIPQGKPARSWSHVIKGDGIRPDWERLGFTPLSWKRLPTRPIWPGFLINTLFWAVILWMLIVGPFALRRLIRRKCGRCPNCGYDLRGGFEAGCPECGWGRGSEPNAPGAEDGAARAV